MIQTMWGESNNYNGIQCIMGNIVQLMNLVKQRQVFPSITTTFTVKVKPCYNTGH